MANFYRVWTSFLLTINLLLCLVGLSLAGWVLNRNINNGNGVPGEDFVGNNVTVYFLPIALIACMVGIAAKASGSNHIKVWSAYSYASAAATASIALVLALLAMGLAIKEIEAGGPNRVNRVKALEGIMIVLAFFEVLYILTLHGRVFGKGYGPTYV